MKTESTKETSDGLFKKLWKGFISLFPTWFIEQCSKWIEKLTPNFMKKKKDDEATEAKEAPVTSNAGGLEVTDEEDYYGLVGLFSNNTASDVLVTTSNTNTAPDDLIVVPAANSASSSGVGHVYDTSLVDADGVLLPLPNQSAVPSVRQFECYLPFASIPRFILRPSAGTNSENTPKVSDAIATRSSMFNFFNASPYLVQLVLISRFMRYAALVKPGNVQDMSTDSNTAPVVTVTEDATAPVVNAATGNTVTSSGLNRFGMYAAASAAVVAGLTLAGIYVNCKRL